MYIITHKKHIRLQTQLQHFHIPGRSAQLDHELETTENLFIDFFASCSSEAAEEVPDDVGGLSALDQVAEFEQLLSDQGRVR